MLDVGLIRAATPGVQHGVHLLAAGSALMPQSVVDAIIDHTQLEARLGGYEAHAARFHALEAVYGDVATLLNARPDEIALVENATIAWRAAFYALRAGLDPAPTTRTLSGQGIIIGTTGRSSTLLDAEARALPDTIFRAAPHYYNTRANIDALCTALETLA